FPGGGFGQQAQCFIFETDLNAVGAKCALVLPKQTSLGIFHDLEEIIRVEVLADHAHGQTSDEFRLESVLDKILSSNVLKQLVVHHLHRRSAKSDLALSDAPGYVFF